MRVYLAAPWVKRKYAKLIAADLRAAGLIVISRWHDEWADRAEADATHDECRDEAVKDWDDVNAADAMLVLNMEKSDGKAIEQGLALAKGIPIVVVGPRTAVFHHLWRFHMVQTVPAAIRLLQQLP